MTARARQMAVMRDDRVMDFSQRRHDGDGVHCVAALQCRFLYNDGLAESLR
jgi:hypothetical protein